MPFSNWRDELCESVWGILPYAPNPIDLASGTNVARCAAVKLLQIEIFIFDPVVVSM